MGDDDAVQDGGLLDVIRLRDRAIGGHIDIVVLKIEVERADQQLLPEVRVRRLDDDRDLDGLAIALGHRERHRDQRHKSHQHKSKDLFHLGYLLLNLLNASLSSYGHFNQLHTPFPDGGNTFAFFSRTVKLQYR